MIIKIDVDDGIDRSSAVDISNTLIRYNHINTGNKAISLDGKIQATITQHSKAGNIFIHVSKTEK